MPLVITSVGVATQTRTSQIRSIYGVASMSPDLEIKLYMANNIIRDLKTTTVMLFGVSHIVFW